MQSARSGTPMGQLWSSIQSWLFPMLEDEIGELGLSACVHAQAGGPAKVAAHLAFGLVVIAAEQMHTCTCTGTGT